MLKAVDIVYKTIAFFLIKYSTQHILKNNINYRLTVGYSSISPRKTFKEEGGFIKGLSLLDIYIIE